MAWAVAKRQRKHDKNATQKRPNSKRKKIELREKKKNEKHGNTHPLVLDFGDALAFGLEQVLCDLQMVFEQGVVLLGVLQFLQFLLRQTHLCVRRLELLDRVVGSLLLQFDLLLQLLLHVESAQVLNRWNRIRREKKIPVECTQKWQQNKTIFEN